MGRVTERRRVVRISTGDATPHVSPHVSPSASPHASSHAGPDGTADAAGSPGAVAGADPAGADLVRRASVDTLVAEEPLEIRVGRAGAPRRALAVTMRTPGDDLDLALGFLFTEGVITTARDVRTAQLCAGTDEPNTYNVVDVTLASEVPEPVTDPSRNFYTTSSCGVCGKASIDAVRTRSRFTLTGDLSPVAAATLTSLPERLRAAQRVFDRTGGLHAAGLFTTAGDLVALREDVGRHNAVDKVVGWAVRQERLPLAGHILLVSGRASFELVQKAWMAGIPALAAVSAPSSLAVRLAEEAGMTLVGFLRGASMNIYTGADRIG